MPITLTLPRPDDWHLHLRDGAMLRAVVGDSAARFARAGVMPNLVPPVTTVGKAAAYRERILAALPPGTGFQPLMILYLTEDTPVAEIHRAAETPWVLGVKLYPAGATTHSSAGVRDLDRCQAVLEAMAEHGVPLLVHGEVTDPEVDVFDREAVFIDRTLAPLRQRLPELKIVLEHVTTAEGIAFVRSQEKNTAATITPQHILMNRNALFQGGLRPHHYCLPVLKREHHRRAVLEAAVSGDPRFFLGTDSAPHPRSAKESACGCAGIYSAHAALELYAEAFEDAGALDRLADFAARFGADFYGLPHNTGTVTLVKEPHPIPESIPVGDESIVPLRAGSETSWRLKV